MLRIDARTHPIELRHSVISHAHHRDIMRTTPHPHATTHAPGRHMSCSTASEPVHTRDVCTHYHHGHCERTIVDPRPVAGSTS
jgi:hypothetical protein